MQLNPSPKVRSALYIITMLGTPFVTILVNQGVLASMWGILWAAEVAVVSALARFNVS